MMTPDMICDRLRRFLLTLESVGPEGERDAFANEVIETGGCYMDPDCGGRPGTHLFEIRLHGISVCGLTEPEARRNWKRIAHRGYRELLEDDGFVTVHPPLARPTQMARA